MIFSALAYCLIIFNSEVSILYYEPKIKITPPPLGKTNIFIELINGNGKS